METGSLQRPWSETKVTRVGPNAVSLMSLLKGEIWRQVSTQGERHEIKAETGVIQLQGTPSVACTVPEARGEVQSRSTLA